ncbi:MAG: 50S ribosome-binding GTPase [Nanoarchaeota archaeon]|nr:50S ribosome-binding GTPase [Nanoarchaeota archaeon]
MVLKIITNFFSRIFSGLFKSKKDISIGFYGPPNGGKTTLANRIGRDFAGREMGKVSKIPHETRNVQFMEEIQFSHKGQNMKFKLVDTPGIATKIDFEDFMKHGLSEKESKKRAKEATRGVIESIKWLNDVDAVVIVLDAVQNPYSQVNITIIGNLVARKLPVLIAANKMDLRKSNIKKIEAAFPEYDVVGISARQGKNMEEFYESLYRLVK